MNAVSRSSEEVVSEEMGQGSRIWQFTFVRSGARIGEECHVCSHCFIENDVVMGDRVTIKSKSGVQLWDGLRVGADAFIGPNATFTNDKHPRSRNTGFSRLTTVIEQSASIGEGALLLPGSRSEKTPWSRVTYPKHLRRRQPGPRDEQRSVMSETQPQFNIDKCRIVEMPNISKLLATSPSSKAGAKCRPIFSACATSMTCRAARGEVATRTRPCTSSSSQCRKASTYCWTVVEKKAVSPQSPVLRTLPAPVHLAGAQQFLVRFGLRGACIQYLRRSGLLSGPLRVSAGNRKPTVNVPFLDLKSTFVELQSEIDEAIPRVLHSGNSIGGAQAEALENTFAGFCGARHVVVVANRLDALKSALQALYVGPGNEVIVSSYTFFGIWLAVNHCGATPVPVEPTRCGFNIDPQRVADRITPKTKETIPVHSYGEPVDLDPLIDIAERHGMFVLEDAAQTLRAVYGGRRIGSHGHAVTWSFYPSKNLGAFGDGGAVSTQVESLARRIRILGNYGFRTQYINDAIAYNRHLDHVQVAIMRAKLPRIDEWNARRHAIAERCDRAFGTLLLPPIPLERQGHAWHLYVVRHPCRDRLQQQLADAWVTTLNHHPCASRPVGSVRLLGLAAGSLPLAEQYASPVLRLPICPHLTQALVDQVIEAVTRFVVRMPIA